MELPVLPIFRDHDGINGDDERGYDAEQSRLMREMCLMVDENDGVIGYGSKKTCHLMGNITHSNYLHRAFSVFVFDGHGRLLLQKRANSKITFPGMWTNSCCSHPLADYPAEIGLTNECGLNKLSSAVYGVKLAAKRKLQHELGVRPDEIDVERINFLTRIHYKAPSDGRWGEHEIDYILFLQVNDIGDLTLQVNANEVEETQYVSVRELKEMFTASRETSRIDKPVFTPWFRLICESGMLYTWWDMLLENRLAEACDDVTIRRLA